MAEFEEGQLANARIQLGQSQSVRRGLTVDDHGFHCMEISRERDALSAERVGIPVAHLATGCVA